MFVLHQKNGVAQLVDSDGEIQHGWMTHNIPIDTVREEAKQMTLSLEGNRLLDLTAITQYGHPVYAWNGKGWEKV